mgnify:CR=1 FL=1
MRGKSHIALGHYLLNRYLPDLPRRYRKAFLIGCIEPDRNPATYLKGSLRCQWLRGHNYHNARRFMRRISLRLEQKEALNLFDYYTLGKLIHYTADAFTFAHNERFPENLTEHREYETQLQNHFLKFLQDCPQVSVRLAGSIMDGISSYHREYASLDTDIHRDSHFALQACCCVLAILLTPRII